MVDTEERKMKERDTAAHEQEEKDIKAGKVKPKKHTHHESEKGPEKKNEEHANTKEAKNQKESS